MLSLVSIWFWTWCLHNIYINWDNKTMRMKVGSQIMEYPTCWCGESLWWKHFVLASFWGERWETAQIELLIIAEKKILGFLGWVASSQEVPFSVCAKIGYWSVLCLGGVNSFLSYRKFQSGLKFWRNIPLGTPKRINMVVALPLLLSFFLQEQQVQPLIKFKHWDHVHFPL